MSTADDLLNRAQELVSYLRNNRAHIASNIADKWQHDYDAYLTRTLDQGADGLRELLVEELNAYPSGTSIDRHKADWLRRVRAALSAQPPAPSGEALREKAAMADGYAKSLSWKLIQTQKPLPKHEADFLRRHQALTALAPAESQP
jgi:hypothetical protein